MVSFGGGPNSPWAKKFSDYWYGERVYEVMRETEEIANVIAEVRRKNPSMSREERRDEVSRIMAARTRERTGNIFEDFDPPGDKPAEDKYKITPSKPSKQEDEF